MPDTQELLRIIKTAALQAVDATKPMALIYGTVIGILPLTVRINKQTELSGDSLYCLRGLVFEGGEQVALLRVQGGGSHLVLGVMI